MGDFKSDLGIKITETPSWSIIGIQIPSILVGVANLKVTQVMDFPQRKREEQKVVMTKVGLQGRGWSAAPARQKGGWEEAVRDGGEDFQSFSFV